MSRETLVKIRLRDIRVRDVKPRWRESAAADNTDLLAVVDSYFERVADQLTKWRSQYEWPRGVCLEEALRRRAELSRLLAEDFQANGSLGAQSVAPVMLWGFGSQTVPPEAALRAATAIAVPALERDHLRKASQPLLRLPNWGISRASKVLALWDQDRFGIYDSRVADGMSDLVLDGNPLVPVPPGRRVRGTSPRVGGWPAAFELFTTVVRRLRDRSRSDGRTRTAIRTASDVEIAFFSRSRLK